MFVIEEMSRGELIVLSRRHDAQIGRQAAEMSASLERVDTAGARLAMLEYLLSRNSCSSSLPLSRDDDLGKTAPGVDPDSPIGQAT